MVRSGSFEIPTLWLKARSSASELRARKTVPTPRLELGSNGLKDRDSTLNYIGKIGVP